MRPFAAARVGCVSTAMPAFAGESKLDTNSTLVLSQSTNGNFILYVSNQSFDITPVDITIHIDGKQALSDEFHVRDQHNWIRHTFHLSSGKHILRAVSEKGEAILEKEFEVKGKTWAVLDFWLSWNHNAKSHFSFHSQDKPIGFM